MSIHSSQIGLVLQNGFVFFGGELSQMGLCAEQLYKMVLMFFQKNEKHLFFQGILLNGFIFFWGIWPGIGACFTKWLWYFSKNNEYIYKMVCSFFWENANSLIQK